MPESAKEVQRRVKKEVGELTDDRELSARARLSRPAST